MSVYFVKPIGADGPVKIGYSEDPVGRMLALMCGSPVRLEFVAVIDGDEVLERRLHAHFAKSRQHGEWFAWSPQLGKLIAAANSDGFDIRDHVPETARSQSDIVRANVSTLVELTGAGINTVRSWAHRDAIPVEHWSAISDAGLATLDEMANARAGRS